MDASQPIMPRRRRTRATDRALSRFIDSEAETSQAPAMVKANASEESISTPRELSNPAKSPSEPLDSVTSGSAQNGDDARHTDANITASQIPAEPSQVTVPTSQLLAGPVSVRRRYQHNATTYKRKRSMRTRSISISVSAPSTQVEQHALSEPPSRASTQPKLSDDTYTPSPSPVPAHASTRTRKRRRRRLPPLKNRLARVARSRLVRVRSKENFSQLPIAIPAPSEYGEEELDVEPEQANATRRRLVAPENYTIPDLKDLLDSTSRSRDQGDTQVVRPTTQRPHPATQRHNPAPRFVLPPRNTIHAPRTPYGSKSPRKPKKEDVPRLNFVALEAHQEQATSRRGASVFGAHRLPLGVTPQPSPTRRVFVTQINEVEEIGQTFNSHHNLSPTRSPSRVLVKATPEPEELCVPKRLDFASVAPSQRIHEEPVPEAGDPNTTVAGQANCSRALAPMSELYDNLVKLARSADKMGKHILPDAPGPFNGASLKRKFEATSTPQLTFEATPPVKAPRL